MDPPSHFRPTHGFAMAMESSSGSSFISIVSETIPSLSEVKYKELGKLDCLKSIKLPNNLIDGEVDVGDWENFQTATMSSQEKLYRIGYALAPTKVQGFIRASLIDHVNSRGIDLVLVDPSKSLIEQGPFDCIMTIHKMYGQDWELKLDNFSVENPNVPIIDSPESIERILHRISMLPVVNRLKIPERSQVLEVPKHADVLVSENSKGNEIIGELESLPNAEDYEVVAKKVIKLVNSAPFCSGPEASPYEGKHKEHDELDRVKSIKRSNNLIDGEVDVGDSENSEPMWSFPPELLVERSTPNAKAKKAYRGGSVSMDSDITDKEGFAGSYVPGHGLVGIPLCSSILGEVDDDDCMLMPQLKHFNPHGLSVKYPSRFVTIEPTVKAKKAYCGGSVPMDSENADQEGFVGCHVPDLESYALLVEFVPTGAALKVEKAYVGGPVPLDIEITEIYQVQRGNLFIGRGYIKGVLCDVVIDGGSTKNIIAESLCIVLDLKLIDHPEPYRLDGIYGVGNVVSKQAWVPFIVGDYGDTQLFDVVPEAAVGLLLGRDWIYDMNVIHYGRANVYEIEKDGRKITLYPLTPSEIQELRNEIQQSRAQNRS